MNTFQKQWHYFPVYSNPEYRVNRCRFGRQGERI